MSLEQDEAKAKQALEALRSQAGIDAERNKWKAKYGAQLNTAQALCSAATKDIEFKEATFRDLKNKVDGLGNEISGISQSR